MNKEQLKAATVSMIDWLAHPAELGKAPAIKIKVPFYISVVSKLNFHLAERKSWS